MGEPGPRGPALSPALRTERNRVQVERGETGWHVHAQRAPGDAGRIEEEAIQRHRLRRALGVSLLPGPQEQRASRREDIEARRIPVPPRLPGLSRSRGKAFKHDKGGDARTTHGDGLKQKPAVG